MNDLRTMEIKADIERTYADMADIKARRDEHNRQFMERCPDCNKYRGNSWSSCQSSFHKLFIPIGGYIDWEGE